MHKALILIWLVRHTGWLVTVNALRQVFWWKGTVVIEVNIALDNFFFSQKKYFFFFILHVNIYCGYSLEVPQQGASDEYSQHILSCRTKKIFTPKVFLPRGRGKAASSNSNIILIIWTYLICCKSQRHAILQVGTLLLLPEHKEV